MLTYEQRKSVLYKYYNTSNDSARLLIRLFTTLNLSRRTAFVEFNRS